MVGCRSSSCCPNNSVDILGRDVTLEPHRLGSRAPSFSDNRWRSDKTGRYALSAPPHASGRKQRLSWMRHRKREIASGKTETMEESRGRLDLRRGKLCIDIDDSALHKTGLVIFIFGTLQWLISTLLCLVSTVLKFIYRESNRGVILFVS